MGLPDRHRHAPVWTALAATWMIVAGSCASSAWPSPTPIDRLSTIPGDLVKMTPENDRNPVHSLSDEFSDPVPMPGGVNTAGGEDGPFVLADGRTFYFFFTPDVRVPIDEQVLDGVTGLYVSTLTDGQWSAGVRVWLEDPGVPALDGCELVQDDLMLFCSAREGYTGMHWFTARLRDGRWQDWQVADFEPSYEVGELHISRDGRRLYFGSERPGGLGQMDIWVSTRTADGGWGEPANLAAVNSPGWEGWPALSPDETELWFSRDWFIWRSRLVNGEWQAPEKMFGPLAGEPTLDVAGNIYFTHHYYDGDTLLEADIYVSQREGDLEALS
jgi:hypothetical protein